MKKKKRILWSIVILFFGFIFIRQQFTIFKLNKDYVDYNNQLKKLQTQNVQLNQELKETSTVSYLERLAREKLGLVKPGEIIFKDKKSNP